MGEAMRSADLFLLMLGKDQSTFGMFEAGLASALEIPMVILLLDDVPVPMPLKSWPTIRSDKIDVVHRALVAVSGASAEQTKFVSKSRALGSRADAIIKEVASATETESLSAIASAIEETGAIVVAADRKQRFDLAVWSDDLSSFGANPLFVDYVRTVKSTTLERVATLLGGAAQPSLALVVFRDDSPSRLRAQKAAGTSYPVLFIAQSELLELMRSRSFARIVRDLRNESVHGRPAT
jgi:hypothetical protein